MIRPLRIELRFSPEEADHIADILMRSQEHTLARRFNDAIERETRYHAAAVAAQEVENERRAKRAAEHILTDRQAGALAAARNGRSLRAKPYSYSDGGILKWGWAHSRSMGGAVCRMIETLIEEGLLSGNHKLTDAGRIRLEAYEAKHGRVGP